MFRMTDNVPIMKECLERTGVMFVADVTDDEGIAKAALACSGAAADLHIDRVDEALLSKWRKDPASIDDAE